MVKKFNLDRLIIKKWDNKNNEAKNTISDTIFGDFIDS